MNYRLLIATLLLPLFNGCAVVDGVNRGLDAFEIALEDAGVAEFDRTARHHGAGRRVSLLAQGEGLGNWRRGSGAVIGPRQILTVDHVVAGMTRFEVDYGGAFSTATARVVARISAVPEDLIVLELDRGGALGFRSFDTDEVFVRATGDPKEAWLPRGLFALAGTRLAPGDSGSPLLDARGHLVALLVGRNPQGPVFARVPLAPSTAPLPGQASPAVADLVRLQSQRRAPDLAPRALPDFDR